MKKILLLISMFVSIAAQAYEPMIREDRIWEYEFIHYNSISPENSFNYTINMKFDGTEVVNNRTYHKLVMWKPSENPVVEQVALMREEESSVYMVLNQPTIAIISAVPVFSEPIQLEPNTEICLYSFIRDRYIGCNERQMIFPSQTQDGPIDESIMSLYTVVMRDREVSANGKTWKITELARNPKDYDHYDGKGKNSKWGSIGVEIIAEGIGNVGRGLLHIPYMSSFPITVGDNLYFLRQKDLYGNVIFDAEWLRADYNGVDETAAPRPADGKSYDISGRPVENPQPGTIYIRNGEKHIAR